LETELAALGFRWVVVGFVILSVMESMLIWCMIWKDYFLGVEALVGTLVMAG
jgi:hypothetical protein